MKKRAIGALVALTAGLGTFTLATPAHAGSCGQVTDAKVSGGQASWAHACSGGYIRVSGWVKDTSADGKCAQVKAMYSNGTQYSAKACPSGTVKYFDFYGPGSSVPVYLFTV
ncbi:hypothetical protein ACFY2M_38455 [Streptomyces sp. NPDC001276]|uniref:hypothetical protein n=1 Tax=Streptomyces sp. NPDC001276 TaxID=3364555 RepID=UPI00368B32E7